MSEDVEQKSRPNKKSDAYTTLRKGGTGEEATRTVERINKIENL